MDPHQGKGRCKGHSEIRNRNHQVPSSSSVLNIHGIKSTVVTTQVFFDGSVYPSEMVLFDLLFLIKMDCLGLQFSASTEFSHPLSALSFLLAGGESSTVLHSITRTSQTDWVDGEKRFALARNASQICHIPHFKNPEVLQVGEQTHLCKSKCQEVPTAALQNAKALVPLSKGTTGSCEHNLRNSELYRFGLEFLLRPRTTCEFLINSHKNSMNLVVSFFSVVGLRTWCIYLNRKPQKEN